MNVRIVPWALGAAALLIMLAWSWSPSLWGDELATLKAVTSFDTLVETLRRRDIVFLPYYLLMYGWTRLGGTADWWVRLPSALGMAVATGMLADLGRRIGGAKAGAVAGVTLLLLPSISRFGQETRPYALAVAAAVFSFWALHRAERGDGGWPVYAVSVALLPCAHLFAVLVLPGHLVLTRRCVPWMAVGSPPALALAWLSAGQIEQVGWLARPGWEDFVLLRSTASAWQPATDPGHFLALVSGWLIVAGALAGLWRRMAVGERMDGEPVDGGSLRLRLGLGVWGAAPTAILYAASYLATPVYASRYVLVAAPAFVLLLGLSRVRFLVVAACVPLVLLPQVQSRLPEGHEVQYREAAGIVEDGERPDDQIIFAAAWSREGLRHYGRMPQDVKQDRPVSARVWLIRDDAERLTPAAVPQVRRLSALGHVARRMWRLRGVTVILLEQPRPGEPGEPSEGRAFSGGRNRPRGTSGRPVRPDGPRRRR
ncbi:glycosyltransferase family 39 protein [Nonomuraea sp. NPDC050783]|uniref:glycosyltransferase family 39 protein n=1 Tax=Nonomuraea sp. NPDC050783 TaxID=3154634 RepID=UPI0034667AB6